MRLVPKFKGQWIEVIILETERLHSKSGIGACVPTLFFFFWVAISLRTVIPLFWPCSIHSGSSSRDDCVPWRVECELVSLIGSNTVTGQQSAHSDFVGWRVYACVGVTCQLYFWQNDRGLLRVTAVTRGCNRHRNDSQHRKLTLERKFLPPSLLGLEPAATSLALHKLNYPGAPPIELFWRSTNWTILALHQLNYPDYSTDHKTLQTSRCRGSVVGFVWFRALHFTILKEAFFASGL